LQVDGWRDLPDRHHTLYQAIDWSYALLTGDERLLLARLSVFTGGCTVEAAESVMLDCPAQITRDGLRSLVNHHLVVQYPHNGGLRYMLLETIRLYATQRLAESGEADRIRQTCADYYLSLAEQAEPFLRTASQLPWLERLEADRPNLRVALAWFLDEIGDIEKGLRLAGALGWFWNIRCHVSEGRQWLKKALQLASEVRPELRINTLHWAGTLAFQQGELAEARAFIEESIALSRQAGPTQRWNLALTLGGLANVVMYQVDQQAVKRAAEESLTLSEQIGDPFLIGLALLMVAEAELLQRDYHSARSHFEAGLASLRKTGDRWGTGIALMDLAYTHLLLGNLDMARTLLEESNASFSEVGERSIRSLTLNILAQVRLQQGDHIQASLLYGECLDLLRKMGIEASIADVQFNLAHFVQAHGNYSLAGRLYNESMKMYSGQGDEGGIARCKAGLEEIGGEED
jgi:tetratricopeptide (TPR) repeat protein